MRIFRQICLFVFSIFFGIILCTGCSNGDSSSSYTWEKVCHLPSADGSSVIGTAPLFIDVSHSDQGYMMVRYQGDAGKVNIQVSGPDGTNYKYFIEPSENYIPITFTGGSGDYIISAYENIEGDQYASLLSETITVSLKDDFLPYLYPNQYVYFIGDSKAVAKASELSAGAKNDIDFLSDVYSYVISNVTYDDEKAMTVELGYLPDIDETMATGKGICFDYAALMAAMLRSCGVPCKMSIGYSNEVKHAWIDVYIEGTGWVDRAIEFDGKEWKLMDPTFASNAEDQKAVEEYIGDGSNYVLQYNY